MRYGLVGSLLIVAALSTVVMTAEAMADGGYVETTGSYAEGDPIRGNRYTTGGALKVDLGGGGAGIVDTELPAAAAIAADNQAAPTAPGVYSYLMCFDGALWDRCLSGLTDTDDGTIATAQVPNLGINLTYVFDGTNWVRLQIGIEDVAETVGGQLMMTGSVRRDAAASSAGTTGDYATINTDATGRLWTNTELPDAAAIAADDQAAPTSPGTYAYMMCFDGTLWDRCRGGASDTDDGTVAGAQVTTVIIGENYCYDGTNWVRCRLATGVTAAAPPLHAHYVAGLGSGATGGFLTAPAVCDTFANINIVTATTTLMVTGVSGRHVRICGLSMLTTIANNVAFVSGTGATCATGTTGMTGGTTAATGYNLPIAGNIQYGGGLGVINQTNATGDSVCIITSAATQLSGRISYAIY